MKKVLGISIRRNRLTDAQYVERLRKEVRQYRTMAKWYALAAAILAIVWLWAVTYIIDILFRGFLGQPPHRLVIGLVLGGVFGFILGGSAFKVAHLIWQAITMWRGDRKSELLLKYHDALAELAKPDGVSYVPAATGQGRGG